MQSGETNLATMLKTLRPVQNPGVYVFCTVPDIKGMDMETMVCFFKEAEGYTLVLPKEKADSMGLPYGFEAAWITLTVHSALEAVGLTAAFATALGNAGISCNTVAAFYHDHIFVPHADADRAMEALQALSA
jgi:uncharacterized protein